MTPEQLLALVAQPEHSLLERKPPTVNRSELRQTLVAFANTVQDGQEAVLLIGVHDDGTLLGTNTPDETQRLVRAVATQDCYPPIVIQQTVIRPNGLNVIAVVVPSSRSRPHFTGSAYVRVGAESVAATAQQYEELIASRHEACRILQTWRTLITVWEVGFQLNHMRAIPGQGRAFRECMIQECTPHIIRIRDDASGEAFAVPMRHIDITYDEQRHRNAITIHA